MTVIPGLPSSVVTDGRLGAGFTESGSTWFPDYAKLAAAEPYATPYTVYVNQANGDDTAKGNSPGQAFATLAKAVNVLQQNGHGGKIVVITMGASAILVGAPLHFAYPIWIEALGPSAAILRRNYSTPNSRSVWDAVTTAAGATINSATAAFVAGDVNAIVSIYGAGTGGGTYYDFIASVTDGSHAVVANGSGTATARNSTTDPHGVKLSIVRTGDQGRIITDASVTAPAAGVRSVITSATANFAAADVGTEIVLGGAGQGGQALRSVIVSVGTSGGNTTATIAGTATTAVTGARCAIGVNFGDMLTYHNGTGGLRNVTLDDQSTGNGTIGSALRIVCEDGGSGSQQSPSDCAFEHVKITSSDANGAWEHGLEVDGSWNQNTGGPGARRTTWIGLKVFGSRRPTETLRLISSVHHSFLGQGVIGVAPTSFAQGIACLDPQKTAGGGVSCSDTDFINFEGVGTYLYMEGQNCNFIGGRVAATAGVVGHRAIELAPSSDHCYVSTINATVISGGVTTQNADEYDAGTNNRIETTGGKRVISRGVDVSAPTTGGPITYETISRRSFTNASQAVGSSGVLLLSSIELPGGTKVSKLGFGGGGTALAWGSGWTGPHFIYGIYDPAGNLFGQSADTGGTQVFNSGLSNTIVAIAKDGSGTTVSSVLVPVGGLCFIGLLINSGTGGSAFTYPSFAGFASGLISAAPALAGTSGSAQTSLPPSITVPLASGISSMVYGGVN